MSIFLQESASIQPRTSSTKFGTRASQLTTTRPGLRAEIPDRGLPEPEPEGDAPGPHPAPPAPHCGYVEGPRLSVRGRKNLPNNEIATVSQFRTCKNRPRHRRVRAFRRFLNEPGGACVSGGTSGQSPEPCDVHNAFYRIQQHRHFLRA